MKVKSVKLASALCSGLKMMASREVLLDGETTIS